MISAPIPAIRRVVVGPATKWLKSRTLYPSSRCRGLSPIGELSRAIRDTPRWRPTVPKRAPLRTDSKPDHSDGRSTNPRLDFIAHHLEHGSIGIFEAHHADSGPARARIPLKRCDEIH